MLEVGPLIYLENMQGYSAILTSVKSHQYLLSLTSLTVEPLIFFPKWTVDFVDQCFLQSMLNFEPVNVTLSRNRVLVAAIMSRGGHLLWTL